MRPARPVDPNNMIALEDSFADVIGKAQRGLRLSDTRAGRKGPRQFAKNSPAAGRRI